MCSNNHQHDKLVLCPQCDMLAAVPDLEQGKKAVCPRCDTLLTAKWKRPRGQPTVYAVSALSMLFLACLFPFISMSVAGIVSEITLTQIPRVMFSEDYSSMAVFFLIFVQFVPTFCMLAIILLCQNVKMAHRLKIELARILFKMKSWCMAEIFLAGILVSFVKLMAYGDISIGLSFLPYCLFCLFQIRAFQCLDRHWFWNAIEPAPEFCHTLQAGKPGLMQGVRLCQCCTAILPAEQSRCPRCKTKGHARRRHSLQCTMALLITSVILYIPANLLPIMVTQALGSHINSTILEGIILLWSSGSYPVAMVIFIASIMVPSLKMLAISWLCWDAKNQGRHNSETMHFIYEIVEFVGRWSMIDVFVIAVLSSLVRMGQLMSIYPAMGAVLFALVVILTMFASMTFDPRLTWDKTNSRFARHKNEES
ncbi:membrane integrity-associated transporter subunit PqiA [Xenorhabdus szentirmaii]|uniref:Paraquat-inducible protein A n=2 Tax=Xenorhabdus szentirmaii TaxID=290112 RepID=W1IXV4_9GAMM|nr:MULTISPECIES: membrane integrity-associated transporter subunit PqiA [Xenorhabdus]MBD2782089.1 membrane integrity-associated transporter subunit PqiA [Xenorhabdus sp. 38]MBD2791472.1 membrane integrity-associated transporter subunit PqiA [Xenorhabdus sp. CUL]MBD2802280.1 membrane integrity-associated transporter subunit PqiA [Xenorhabdus sp. M]MBD2803890.1 membrane integrity-associated transporter subunit PqiA [Xenorhabdus sp. ZM]MBD2819506.1 membrane integrity-associated transporter subuni